MVGIVAISNGWAIMNEEGKKVRGDRETAICLEFSSLRRTDLQRHDDITETCHKMQRMNESNRIVIKSKSRPQVSTIHR